MLFLPPHHPRRPGRALRLRFPQRCPIRRRGTAGTSSLPQPERYISPSSASGRSPSCRASSGTRRESSAPQSRLCLRTGRSPEAPPAPHGPTRHAVETERGGTAATRGSFRQSPRHVAASRSRPVAPPHPPPPPAARQRPRAARGSGCSDPLPRGTKRGRRPRGPAVPVTAPPPTLLIPRFVLFFNSFFFFALPARRARTRFPTAERGGGLAKLQ